MYKQYRYRLLPTEEQKEKLAQYFGASRFIYNLALETKIAAWTSLRVSLSAFDLMKQMAELKRTDCLWLQDCSCKCLQASISNLDKAYKSFFRGAGFPKFKRKSGRQSIQFRQDCRVENSSIRLAKFGFIKFIEHRGFPNTKVRTVTIIKTTTNKYFVSILTDDNVPIPCKLPIVADSAVGVDVGLKSFAVLSDGTQYDKNAFLQASQKRLRIEQRKLDRRYKSGTKIANQSKSWHKQRMVVALIHEKIVNQRLDFLHKLSTSIIKKFDTVCMESLNVAGMIKNKCLSKSISDAGWFQFSRLLEYKAEWSGKNIVYINMFAPSSKKCSDCGELNNDLKLSDRNWTCRNCGTEHDRDHNAAINIKKLGLETKPSTVNVVH